MAEEQDTVEQQQSEQEDEGAGEGRQPSPLEQQALDAIEQLRDAGQEVPQALEAAVREFRQARKEAATYRSQSKQQQEQQADAMRQLAKAFGIDVADDADPDPQQLHGQIEQSQREARQARLELAAWQAAGRAGADADALLDSRSFLTALENLDPADDKFAEQLDAAVAKAVEGNARLRATPGGRSAPGSLDAGATGGTPPVDIASEKDPQKVLEWARRNRTRR